VTDPAPAPSQFHPYVALLERVGPAALAEIMPRAPSREELLAHFPDLVEVEARDVSIDRPHGEVPPLSPAVNEPFTTGAQRTCSDSNKERR
jgi:hypothetical protein